MIMITITNVLYDVWGRVASDANTRPMTTAQTPPSIMNGLRTFMRSETTPTSTTATASADQNQFPRPFASDWEKPKTETK